MQQGDALRGPQAGQRRLELHRLIDRFLHEPLHRGLTPRAERRAAESARETFRTRDADTVNLTRLAIQNPYSDVGENATDDLMLARLIVVVSEHSDNRDPHGSLEFVRQDHRLFLQSVVRQIAAQQEDVRLFVDVSQQRLQLTLRGLLYVQIADCG